MHNFLCTFISLTKAICTDTDHLEQLKKVLQTRHIAHGELLVEENCYKWEAINLETNLVKVIALNTEFHLLVYNFC